MGVGSEGFKKLELVLGRSKRCAESECVKVEGAAVAAMAAVDEE